MANRMTFAAMMKAPSDANAKLAVASIHRRTETVQADIHAYLVMMVAAPMASSGNKAVAANRVNMLLDDLPKGIRSNAIKAWVEGFLGFVYVTEGENKGKFVAGKRNGADLDMKDLTNRAWFSFKPEPEYKPMDFDNLLESLINKGAARAKVAKPEEGDKVDSGLIIAIADARKAYLASKAVKIETPAGRNVAPTSDKVPTILDQRRMAI